MRSVPRRTLAALAGVPHVQWVALAQEEWDDAMVDAGWENGLAGCSDWLDSARALQRLDLVISVDTAIGHVAGGLGIPTWLLIAAVPDMRWMMGSRDTPWYRSVTLYRQRVAGDWRPVLDEVAADLTQLILHRHHCLHQEES